LRSTGKSLKKTSEGKTIQKIPCESSMTLSVSLVSRYNQTIAKREVRGREAKTAARKLERLATSEMLTMTKEVKTTFKRV
jgi:hypothetical protein